MENGNAMKVLTVDDYLLLCVKVMNDHGIDVKHAKMVADALCWCDMHGITSHGMNMLPTYIDRADKGGIIPNNDAVLIKQTGAVGVMDGQGGFGQVIGQQAMQTACDLAKDHGIGVISMRNGNHAGALGYYTEMATRNGCIGFMVHNSNPTVAPFGGRKAALGTNPISFAFPGKQFPMVLDMATSATAKGKIYELARKGDTIPAGLALNANGDPTTSAAEAIKGVLVPLGGPKGYGLALTVEMLAGVLGGGKLGIEVESFHHAPGEVQGVSMTVMAIRVDAFLEETEYFERVEKLISGIKATPTATGFQEISMPGERESHMAEQRKKEGVPVLESLYNEVVSLKK